MLQHEKNALARLHCDELQMHVLMFTVIWPMLSQYHSAWVHGRKSKSE